LRQKFFARDAAVRVAAGDPSQWPAWPHDGIGAAVRGYAVAKFQTVSNKRINPEWVRQRPEKFQECPNKHDPLAIAHRLDQLIGSFAAQLRL